MLIETQEFIKNAEINPKVNNISILKNDFYIATDQPKNKTKHKNNENNKESQLNKLEKEIHKVLRKIPETNNRPDNETPSIINIDKLQEVINDIPDDKFNKEIIYKKLNLIITFLNQINENNSKLWSLYSDISNSLSRTNLTSPMIWRQLSNLLKKTSDITGINREIINLIPPEINYMIDIAKSPGI